MEFDAVGIQTELLPTIPHCPAASDKIRFQRWPLSNSEPPSVESSHVKSDEAAGSLAVDATIQRSPVVTRAGLRRVLGPVSESTLSVLINQLVRARTLVRVRPGLFINTTRPSPARGMSLLLTALRPNSLCYLSFESALSYWGSIDQVPTIWTFAPGILDGLEHALRARVEPVFGVEVALTPAPVAAGRTGPGDVTRWRVQVATEPGRRRGRVQRSGSILIGATIQTP